MRRSRILLALLVVLCIVSVLSLAAFAEPEETSSEPEASSEEPVESSEPASESSETSFEPAVGTTITVTGDKEAVKVYFGGSAVPAESFTAETGAIVSFRVEMNPDYELGYIRVGNSVYQTVGTYSIFAEGDSVQIAIKATYTGEPSVDPSSDDPSVDPSDDPSVDPSADPSDDPSVDPSDDPSSEDPSSEDPQTGIPFRVTIAGPGVVTVNDTRIENVGSGNLDKTIYLPDIGEAQQVTVKMEASYGYRIGAITLDGAPHSVVSQMVLNVTGETRVIVTFSPEEVAPGNYEITVSCSNVGGYISAGGFEITAGSSKTISVSAGGSLKISVVPSDGYEVDTFKVGGQTQNLSGGSYVISGVAANTSVTVSFKKSTVPVVTVEAGDLNWNADADGVITLDLRGKSQIGKSVFDKINTLTQASGSLVEIRTDYICWFVPCGSKIGAPASDPVRISVAMNVNSTQYDSISSAFLATNADAIFDLYEVSGLPTLPDGSYVSYNMLEKGINYAGNPVIQYSKQTVVKDGQNKTSLVPGAQSGKVGSDGWTTRMPYANSSILIACIQPASSYTIRSSVQGVGGMVTPSGDNTVNKDGSMSFQINAETGFIISAVYVDGKAVPGAAGEASFLYSFDRVTTDHTLSATFIPAASDYTVSDGVAVITSGEESDGGSPVNVGLVVSLIVIAIAVIGAAVLFIVKYRQERF